jgi:hypothetical protein
VSGERITLSAWIYAAMSVLAIVEAFADNIWLAWLSAALIVTFIAIEFPVIPRPQQFAGAALIGLGTLGAYLSGSWADVFIDGITRARVFLLLFFAISWLQLPARESPSLHAARTAIVNRPPGQRYLFLGFGVHVLGSILNIAGFSLLTVVVERETDPERRRRLSLNLMQGFTAASCWSPFYVAMVVVLVAIPTLHWGELAPIGMTMSALIILSGWMLERTRGQIAAAADSAPAPPLTGRATLRAAAVLISLIALVMGLSSWAGTSIPVTLGIVGPPYALMWAAAMAGRRAAWRRAAELPRRVVANLPTLRNESLVFVAANIFGLGVASAIPAKGLAEVIDALVPWADARIALLGVTFVVCGMMGLHPIIVVLFLSAVFPPDVIGLQDWVLGLTYLGCWGLSTMVSPFSGTTLFMSRVTGVPGHIIAWRWSPPTAVLAACVVVAMVIVLRHAWGG